MFWPFKCASLIEKEESTLKDKRTFKAMNDKTM